MAHSLAEGTVTLEQCGESNTPKVTPPYLELTPHRYGDGCDTSGSEGDAADSYYEEAGGDMATPLVQTGHEQGGLHTATRVFLSKFGPAWKGPINSETVSQELSLPAKDVHALLAVLEVLQVGLSSLTCSSVGDTVTLARHHRWPWPVRRDSIHKRMALEAAVFKVSSCVHHLHCAYLVRFRPQKISTQHADYHPARERLHLAGHDSCANAADFFQVQGCALWRHAEAT